MAHKDMVGAAMAAAPAQAVARVEITMLADGNVVAKCQVPNRQVLFMMLETAKFDLEAKLREQAQQAIEVAPPGLLLPN